MSGFTAIELEKLPAPSIVEALDYETLLGQILQQFRSLAPEYNNLVESDPAYKVLEISAYTELIIRQRINNTAKGLMLAYAQGSNLEHIAALFGIERQLVNAGDDNAIPPVVATFETDERLRRRTQLSLEGFSTAGSIGSYVFWGLSADVDVRDISIQTPTPNEIEFVLEQKLVQNLGETVTTQLLRSCVNTVLKELARVEVTILSETNEGHAFAELLNTVYEAVNAEDIRPLTDHVKVQSAEIVHYQIEANLYFYSGPDATTVLNLAETAVKVYCQQHWMLGHDITVSGLHQALHQTGVQRVDLISPAEGLIISPSQAAFCTDFIVRNAGLDE